NTGGRGGGSGDADNGVDDREKSIGFSPSVAMNPVNFLLDLANGLGLALGALVMDLKSAAVLGSVIISCWDLNMRRTKPITVVSRPVWLLGCCLVAGYPAIKSIGLGREVLSLSALLITMVCYRLIAYVALMKIGVPKK
ncbi:hypothetical protein Tco_0984522, partial [Tanacetum coccineum]